MNTLVHTLHVILAGAWLGGVVFTTAVVSPSLKAIKWSEAERVSVRAMIGKKYARVGTVNLVLLLVFAVLDGLMKGFGAIFYVEYLLLAAIFGLVAAHGAYFGQRLARMAEAERRAVSTEEARTFATRRHALQRLSFRVSLLDVLISAVVVALAVNT
jgi:uncharacterized membrane protein